jgi:hypothetical protein
MSTQALTADAQVLAAVTYVSSALAFPVKAVLDTAFAADAVLRVEATSTGPIEVCDQNGARIGYVMGGSSALVTRRSGTNAWELFTQPSDPVAFLTAVPAGGTGTAAGGWDTAGNRDLGIATLQALRAEAMKRGWFKAE